MSRRLSFEFDVEKFVNASAYLAERCPEVTRMKLFKLLFYADKEHLLTYGRPIIGDRYIKMDHGPVPSRGYDLMKHGDHSTAEDQALFDSYLAIQGNEVCVRLKPNLGYLSETDIEVLDDIVGKYGHLTAVQLSKLSHGDPAWVKADLNDELDYRLFFAHRPDAENMKLLVQEDQELRDALADMDLENISPVLQP
jgi:uncharacterized phage-associated protein